MIVHNDDYLNTKEYPIDIPVRNGCFGGACACSGYCKEIVGTIKRDVYTPFIENYIPIELFIETNFTEVIFKAEDEKDTIYDIHIVYTPNKMILYKAEKEMNLVLVKGLNGNGQQHYEIKSLEELKNSIIKFNTSYPQIDIKITKNGYENLSIAEENYINN